MNFECTICELCGIAVEKINYKRHMKHGHKEKPENKCHICQKLFTSSYNLQYHLAHHINAREFLCNECSSAFNTASDLAQHQRIHDKNREPYRCGECGLLFQMRNQFTAHIKSHLRKVKVKQAPPSRDLKCEICDDSFSNTRTFNRHMKTHFGKFLTGPRPCPVCKETVANLNLHYRTVHLKLESQNCEHCTKQFSQKGELNRHIQSVHLKLKPFKCEIPGCQQSFSEKGGLLRHLGTHSAFKPANLVTNCTVCRKPVEDIVNHYKRFHATLYCKICLKTFARERSLRNHTKNYHSTERSMFCDTCGKGFAIKRQLRRHVLIHQKFPKVLPETVPNELKRQTSTEPKLNIFNNSNYECNSCDRTFTTKFGRDRHFRTAHSSSFKTYVQVHLNNRKKANVHCSFCKKSYENLREHFAVEHSEYQDRCDICPRLFKNTEFLTAHMKRFHRGFYEDDDNFNCDLCKETFDDKAEIRAHMKIHSMKLDPEGITFSPVKMETPEIVLFNIKNEIVDTRSALKYEPQITLKIKQEPVFETSEPEYDHFNDSYDSYEISLKADDSVNAISPIKQEMPMKEENDFESDLQAASTTDLVHHTSVPDTKPENILPQFFQCNICYKSQPSASSLKRHQRVDHKNSKTKTFSCKFCKETFCKDYRLQKHLLQVHKNGLQAKRTCQPCNLDFVLFDDFKKHIESHPDDLICVICGLGFQDKVSFGLHQRSHKAVNKEFQKFFCDHCPAGFISRNPLMNHMKSHMKKTDFYVCKVCGQGFKYSGTYNYHMKVHMNQKDFVCTICGMPFIRKRELIFHIRKHTNEKPYGCLICDEKFATKPFLNRHLQTHPATRKDHSCKDCNLTFIKPKALKIHEQQFHPERLPFTCNICTESFKLEHYLRIHKKRSHPPE